MIILATVIIGLAYLLVMQACKAHEDIKDEVQQSLKYVPRFDCRYTPHPKYRVVTRY